MGTNDNGNDRYAQLKVRPGDRVHVTRAVILPVKRPDDVTYSDGLSELLERGVSFTLTAEILEANRQRDGGYGIFEKIGQEDAILGLGPWPEHITPFEWGSPDWQAARDAAVREAKSLPDRKEQRAALTEVDRKYGPAQATSRTTRYVPSADD
ncbi:hypothetical protein [Agromyces aerolatus]|uniref:hypothetical protein n=1 Tax=Agromyces sp. LY-1074 TaxID=3074080 RepID=UPI002860CEF1|nr:MULTISPECIES: hypothetical protein [unclassified Agromyces]MDR5699956.1 hypothetical protein [Agromyces sp. LY-1074]MDR5706232.1 hypothetical protein [Agromyces sp. LY-1358]